MFTYCLLAALCLSAVYADDAPPRVVCGDVASKADLNLHDLAGNWVTVETLEFSDGRPSHAHDDELHKVCLYSRMTETSTTGVNVAIDTHVPGKDKSTETISITTIAGEDHGRFSLHSDKNDRENWELMVLDSDPAKYLVYLLCLPPNEAGERLPSRVNLLSRHEDHSDHEVLTADEELKLEKRVGEKLHLTGSGAQPTKLSHDCWASYAEPQ